jgi:pimeloyl-ACP methyl ester carboxylesterase
MALDSAPRLYLGRPGQLGARCPPEYWTDARYGEAVVESMAKALRSHPLARGREGGFVLIGFSGGATLAFLRAERLPEVRAVVSVAGNLDVAAWSHHHGYAPLRDSLDPARRPPLPASVHQIHLLAESDERVPPALLRDFLAAQPGPRVHRYPEFDHSCCWTQVWPEILREVSEPGSNSELDAPSEGPAVAVDAVVPQ